MTLEEFVADERTADAVMGDAIIVGEAAKRAIEASPELEANHPALRLREGRALRNETVREYEKLDLEDLFVTVGERSGLWQRQQENFSPSRRCRIRTF